MNIKLHTIFSGAQQGVDIAALMAAEHVKIKTGGFCPKECLTENGPRPSWINRFNLTELKTYDYRARTCLNIDESDGTLCIYFNPKSPGTSFTINYCKEVNKPILRLNFLNPSTITHLDILNWLDRHNIGILNIAGNRESKAPGIYDKTYPFLLKLFTLCIRIQGKDVDCG